MSFLGVEMAQCFAVAASRWYELMTLFRKGRVADAMPRTPPSDEWRQYYWRSRSVLRDAFELERPRFAGRELSFEKMDGQKLLARRWKAREGSLQRLIRRELVKAGPEGRARWRQALYAHALRDYKNHLRELRKMLCPTGDGNDGDLVEELRQNPAAHFYIRVQLPCMLAFQSTPLMLLRDVRGANAGVALQAVERLVRLDPMAVYLPDVERWIHGTEGETRKQRQKDVRKWSEQGLEHGQLPPSQVKRCAGGLIAAFVARFGSYIDLGDPTLQMHQPRCTAEQVRELLDAAEQDRVGKSRGIVDQDISEVQTAYWRAEVRRYAELWGRLLPGRVSRPDAQENSA